MSLEIRWFFEGDVPDAVRRWFEGLAGGLASPVKQKKEERTDTYLVTQDKNVGVKLREEKLEIKWRTGHRRFSATGEKVSGQAEDWCKRTWSDKGKTPAEKTGETVTHEAGFPWVDVKKVRRQCKLALAEGKLVPVEGWAEQAFLVELTSLSLRRKSWWSLGVDVLADEKEAMQSLRQGAEALFADYSGPDLDTGNSYGYPEWIWQQCKVES